MSLRKTNLVDGEYYHIYNRGNSKQKIFLDKSDYDHFVKLLFLCNTEKSIRFREDIIYPKINARDFERGENIVQIGAWVLMPNHFHLYITSQGKTLGEGQRNSISVFMQKIATAYSSYFNKKYDRTGSLFEGKFKSVHVNKDNQAKYLFAYIHLNPLKLIQKDWKENGIKNKKAAIDFLKSYKWSSYLDYTGEVRKEGLVLERKSFLNYFQNQKEFNDDVFDWLSFKNEENIF